jgi:hypothetical protein
VVERNKTVTPSSSEVGEAQSGFRKLGVDFLPTAFGNQTIIPT